MNAGAVADTVQMAAPPTILKPPFFSNNWRDYVLHAP